MSNYIQLSRALHWAPMIFFSKIPEIDLQRFSFQFYLEVIKKALHWAPMIFFSKIPEIDLQRFSFQFSLEVIKKLQHIWIGNFLENLQYLKKHFFNLVNSKYENIANTQYAKKLHGPTNEKKLKASEQWLCGFDRVWWKMKNCILSFGFPGQVFWSP